MGSLNGCDLAEVLGFRHRAYRGSRVHRLFGHLRGMALGVGRRSVLGGVPIGNALRASENSHTSTGPVVVGLVLSNNTLERTVMHRGPRLSAAWPSWPAAQLGR